MRSRVPVSPRLADWRDDWRWSTPQDVVVTLNMSVQMTSGHDAQQATVLPARGRLPRAQRGVRPVVSDRNGDDVNGPSASASQCSLFRYRPELTVKAQPIPRAELPLPHDAAVHEMVEHDSLHRRAVAARRDAIELAVAAVGRGEDETGGDDAALGDHLDDLAADVREGGPNDIGEGGFLLGVAGLHQLDEPGPVLPGPDAVSYTHL